MSGCAMLYENYLRMMAERGDGVAEIPRNIAFGIADWIEKMRDIHDSNVNLVPVIRCYECKYLDESLAVGEWSGSCRYWNTHSVDYTWYCSQAVRKIEEDHNE